MALRQLGPRFTFRDMAHYLKPHSEEWFAALTKLEPTQAAHTMQIIELARKPDVCSACGDSPARDYEIVKRLFAKEVPATIRLCSHSRRRGQLMRLYAELGLSGIIRSCAVLALL
jgi:hypothetical protein